MVMLLLCDTLEQSGHNLSQNGNTLRGSNSTILFFASLLKRREGGGGGGQERICSCSCSRTFFPSRVDSLFGRDSMSRKQTVRNVVFT